MPKYEFICEKCQIKIEEEHSITEKLRDSCPKCEATEPVFHQNYQKTVPFTLVKEVNCVGLQAEANQKRWGKELTSLKGEAIRNEYSNQAAGRRIKGGKPLGRKPVSNKKPLDLGKIKNVKKYIEEGKA